MSISVPQSPAAFLFLALFVVMAVFWMVESPQKSTSYSIYKCGEETGLHTKLCATV